ncbi:hypothetical protein SLE2022_210350 [Rubroshorea leprosula]
MLICGKNEYFYPSLRAISHDCAISTLSPLFQATPPFLEQSISPSGMWLEDSDTTIAHLISSDTTSTTFGHVQIGSHSNCSTSLDMHALFVEDNSNHPHFL